MSVERCDLPLDRLPKSQTSGTSRSQATPTLLLGSTLLLPRSSGFQRRLPEIVRLPAQRQLPPACAHPSKVARVSGSAMPPPTPPRSARILRPRLSAENGLRSEPIAEFHRPSAFLLPAVLPPRSRTLT